MLCFGQVTPTLSIRYFCASSLALSVAAQKTTRISHHPICSVSGITRYIVSFFLWKYISKIPCVLFAHTYSPVSIFRSIFEKRIGTQLSGTITILQTILSITFPNSYIVCCSASFFVGGFIGVRQLFIIKFTIVCQVQDHCILS